MMSEPVATGGEEKPLRGQEGENPEGNQTQKGPAFLFIFYILILNT